MKLKQLLTLALLILVSANSRAHSNPSAYGAPTTHSSDIKVISQNPTDREPSQCKNTMGKPATLYGAPMALGQGIIQSFVTLSANATPKSIGLILTEKALQGLPQEHLYLEYEMDLPCKVPPFTHIGFDWNRKGHPPEVLFGVPHFDAHFYMIPKSVRHNMTCTGNDQKNCQRPPANSKFIPKGYVSTTVGTERMGMHWADPKSAELKDGFKRILIYGFYKGQMAFIEPMFTLDYLLSRPNQSVAVAQPEKYQKKGFYPMTYSIRHDPSLGVYIISLDGLQKRMP